jgi:hypothetical protein
MSGNRLRVRGGLGLTLILSMVLKKSAFKSGS